jgi:putative colanic acid biosynthesis acetyltransferase WcaF
MRDRDPKQLEIATCRGLRPYSQREYLLRILWTLATPLFRFSPRPYFGWRRMLLRLFGAQVGAGAHVYPSARIYLPWKLTLGKESSVGQWALVYNLGPVTIRGSMLPLLPLLQWWWQMWCPRASWAETRRG